MTSSEETRKRVYLLVAELIEARLAEGKLFSATVAEATAFAAKLRATAAVPPTANAEDADDLVKMTTPHEELVKKLRKHSIIFIEANLQSEAYWDRMVSMVRLCEETLQHPRCARCQGTKGCRAIVAGLNEYETMLCDEVFHE